MASVASFPGHSQNGGGGGLGMRLHLRQDSAPVGQAVSVAVSRALVNPAVPSSVSPSAAKMLKTGLM